MRPDELRNFWNDFGSYGWTLPTVEFYGHSTGPHRCFSNFFEHAPFDFTVPESCGRAELIAAGRPATVACAFSEKAIMLCKAAAMGDYASYDEIVRSPSPAHTKKCGRKVGHWDQRKWNSIVVEVGVQSVLQKFSALPNLKAILLGTGDRLIAEMVRTDANWGTGLDVGHPDGSRPARWKGTNILGYALLATRAELRRLAAEDGGGDDGSPAAAAAAPEVPPAAAKQVSGEKRAKEGDEGEEEGEDAEEEVEEVMMEEEEGPRSGAGGKLRGEGKKNKGRKAKRAAKGGAREWLE